jgi:hypothetical protein
MDTHGERLLIQFPHPGPEHRRPSGQRRGWAAHDTLHARTFLLSPGSYRTAIGGHERNGELVFWGEWEGPATVVEDVPRRGDGPTWLARPEPTVSPREVAAAARQNTDPFVWGQFFAYTACKQESKPLLRSLGRGSVIAFGSARHGRFVLDTVLVVDDWVDHDRFTYNDRLAGVATPEHLEATLHPWYGSGLDTTTFRFYRGATPQRAVDGMFSFVPCLPHQKGKGFERPAVFIDGLITPDLRQGFRANWGIDHARVRHAWRDLATQVLDAGLALGTRFDLPDQLAAVPAAPRHAAVSSREHAHADGADRRWERLAALQATCGKRGRHVSPEQIDEQEAILREVGVAGRPARNPRWTRNSDALIEEWHDYWTGPRSARNKAYFRPEEQRMLTLELEARGLRPRRA